MDSDESIKVAFEGRYSDIKKLKQIMSESAAKDLDSPQYQIHDGNISNSNVKIDFKYTSSTVTEEGEEEEEPELVIFVLEIGRDMSIGVFSAWLYNKLQQLNVSKIRAETEDTIGTDRTEIEEQEDIENIFPEEK